MIEINLIPDVKQELIRARTQRSAVVSISIVATLAALALVVVLSIYVFGVQTVRSAIADGQIKKGADQLAQVEDLSKILTIQNQLTKINSLNDDKKIDSRVFQILQAIIPPAPNSVTVSNLTINTENNSLTFEGQTPTYPSLETFKKTIAAANIRYTDNGEQKDVPLASDLSISNISYGEDSTGAKVVRFTVSFTYADETFSPSVTNPSIVLINGGNVTDSYQGIPKSIFADRATDTGASK
jgi:Tfp pilus assembly protein PilN